MKGIIWVFWLPLIKGQYKSAFLQGLVLWLKRSLGTVTDIDTGHCGTIISVTLSKQSLLLLREQCKNITEALCLQLL